MTRTGYRGHIATVTTLPVHRGRIPYGQSITMLTQQWSESLDAWTGWLQLRGLSPETIRVRNEHLRYLANHAGAPSPDTLTRPGVLALFAGKNWSTSHRKTLRESIRSFYRWAVDNQIVADDISDCLPPVKSSTPAPRPATDAIWRELLAKAPPRERLMIRLAGEAGLRRAEVASLHADDLTNDDQGYSLIIRGKDGKQRVVPIFDDLAAVVRSAGSGWVFASREGDGPIAPHTVGVLVSRLMPPGWSMHKLRHRYATRGYSGTGNLRAVQEALGHASVATTQRYTAVSSRDVRSVAEAAVWPDDAA